MLRACPSCLSLRLTYNDVAAPVWECADCGGQCPAPVLFESEDEYENAKTEAEQA